MRYAMTRPSRVTGLVLQGAPLDDAPAPLATDASVLPITRLTEMFRRGDRAGVARALSQHPLMSAGARRTQAQAEIDAMLAHADEAMANGAIGFSTGLFYPPNAAADLDEVSQVAALVSTVEMKESY